MISVEADIQPVLKALQEIGLSQKAITRKVLTALGRTGKKLVSSEVRSKTKNGTGSLVKSFGYSVSKKNFLIFQPRGKQNLIKSYVLMNGITIKPKNGEYLTFKIKEKWVKKRSITIQPRGWFYESLDRYMSSGASKKVFEDVLSKEINRVWERNNK